MSYKHPVRTYRKLDAQFWLDRVVATLTPLSPSGQALLLYLCLCREGHIIPGVVLLGVAAIAEILGWTYDDTRKCMDELVEVGEILLDQRIRLIFVFRAVEVNAPDNPNVVKGWWRIWADLPDSDLKSIIHRHLEIMVEGRGPSFLEAFHEACPDSSANEQRNQFRNPSWKGSENQDTGSGARIQEQEHDPGLRTLAGAGLLPCRDSGVPGQEQGLGSGPGNVLPYAPADWDRTFDDVIDVPETPESLPTRFLAPVGPSALPVDVPDSIQKAWSIIEAWNTKVAPTKPVFDRVEGRQAENLIPYLVEALKDPLAESEFLDLFEVIPIDPFYAGDNSTGFKAFLAHYVKMDPDHRKNAVGAARGKLVRLNRSGEPSAKPKLKSEAAAAALRKGQRNTQMANTALMTNNIFDLASPQASEA